MSGEDALALLSASLAAQRREALALLSASLAAQRTQALALLSASLTAAVAPTARQPLFVLLLAVPSMEPLPLLPDAAALAAAACNCSAHLAAAELAALHPRCLGPHQAILSPRQILA